MENCYHVFLRKCERESNACFDQLQVRSAPLGHFWSQETRGTKTWFYENNYVVGKLFIYLLQSEAITTESNAYGRSRGSGARA